MLRVMQVLLVLLGLRRSQVLVLVLWLRALCLE